MSPPDGKGIGIRPFSCYEVATVVMQILLMAGGFDVDGGVELTLVDVNIDIPKLPPTHPIERYINHVLFNISDSKFPFILPQQPNLSKPEKSALRSLRTNPTSLFSLSIGATLLSSSTGMITFRRRTVTFPIDPRTNA